MARGVEMLRRVTMVSVLTLALLGVGIGGLLAPASASARCANNDVPYHGQFYFEITATKLRKISCKEALKIGTPLWHAKLTLPAKYFPPPWAGVFGVPGGQGRSFGLSTPAGHFTCHITIRLSDTIAADCHRGKHSANVNVHRDCCHKARDLGQSPSASSSRAHRGGYGLVTLDGIGPRSHGSQALTFDESKPPALRAFAGRASRVIVSRGAAVNFQAAEQLWIYAFPRQGRVFCTFVWSKEADAWLLEGFGTTLERFHTARGSKVGMSLANARRREHLRLVIGCLGGLWRYRKHPPALLILSINGIRVQSIEAYGPNPPVVC